MLKALIPVDGSRTFERAVRHVIALTTLVMGSVATKVLHRSTVPVTLVK